MAKSALEATLEKWEQRKQIVQAAGKPESLIAELMKRDIDDVKRGGNPLTQTEVNLAIANQLLGKPVVNRPVRESGWENIPGNFVNDVGDIARGFIPGLVNFVRQLPKHAAKTGDILADERTYQGDAGEVLRSVAAAPLLGLIPGLTTAAGATTPEGRTSLAQHPAMAALDVLPLAGRAGKTVSRGRIAAPNSAIEALQQGRVVRAGVRAGMDTVSKIPKIGTAADRAKYAQMAANLGISAEIRSALAVPYNRLLKKSQRDMLVLFQNRIKPIFDDMNDADQTELYKLATTAPDDLNRLVDEGGVDPKYTNALAEVRKFNQELAHTGLTAKGLTEVPIAGTMQIYSSDSPVAIAYKDLQYKESMFAQVTERWARLHQKLIRAEENLMSRSGKIRHFMEDLETFNARVPEPMSPAVVQAALRPFIESWRDLDPRKVYEEYASRIVDGDLRKAAATQLGKDFKKLEGDTGLISRLDDALTEGNVKLASKTATEIARVFKHKAWEGANTTHTLRSFFSDIRDELVGLSGKTRKSGYAHRMYQSAKKQVEVQKKKVDNWQAKRVNAFATLNDLASKNPSPNFQPMLAATVKQRAEQAARGIYDDVEALGDALHQIETATTFTAIKNAIGAKNFDVIYMDVVENWIDLVKKGYNPIWIHAVTPDRYEQVLRTRILPDQNMKPAQFRDTYFNFGSTVMDVRAGITAAAAELISYKATGEFIQKHLMRFARPTQDVLKEYVAMYDGQHLPHGVDVTGWAKKEMEKNWSDFDPNKYGVSHFVRETDESGLVLPKGVDRALTTMMGEGKRIPLVGAYDKAMQVYKYSVLTGPRHLADEAFGGLVMLALRDPVAVPRAAAAMFGKGKAANLARAWRRGDLDAATDETMTMLMHPLYDLPTHEIAEFSSGKTMARLLKGIGWGPQKLMQLEEWISNVQRVSAYISAQERGARKVRRRGLLGEELDDALELSERQAQEIALKTFIDVDSMLPIERAVLKRIFPFYAWIRHSFRYMMTLPTDHPVRVAILSRFAAMEQKDWDSGLPDKFKSFFWFGDAGEDGRTLTIDWRAANPWRDFASNFTLAGFLSSMSPMITAGFEAAGVDTLGAVPELYPEVTYDPVTGNMKSTRTDTIPKIVEAFIPQFGLVDAAAGITERMRRLRVSNPEAFRRELWNNLNMPFPPTWYDPVYERQRSELNRSRSASREVSAAKRTGDWSDAKRYDKVPFQGELVDPAQLEKLQNVIRELLSSNNVEGVNPFSVLPRG